MKDYTFLQLPVSGIGGLSVLVLTYFLSERLENTSKKRRYLKENIVLHMFYPGILYNMTRNMIKHDP